MSGITTHVLDTVLGKPAAGVAVRLEKQDGEAWVAVGASETDADGRCSDLAAECGRGQFIGSRLQRANTFERWAATSIYPEIAVTFTTAAAKRIIICRCC